MADNVVLDVGVGGDTIAADEIGGVKFSRSKLIHGNDGINDGDVSKTNPLPTRPPKITWAAPGFSTVGTSSAEVLAANAARQGATFINDSNAVIYLGIGAPAVLGSGKRLNMDGGSYEINSMNLSTQAINAISTGASKNLAVDEAT